MSKNANPPGDEPNVDAAFNDIVSQWQDAPAAPELPEPDANSSAAEDVTDPPTASPFTTQWTDPASKSGSNSARAYSLAEPEDHFVPEEPPPLTMPSWRSWLSWIPVVTVPVFFVFCAIAWRDVPKPLITVASVLFLLGAGMLIALLRSEPRDPDDDGAVL